jgi:large subunit ribosomal protein L28e
VLDISANAEGAISVTKVTANGGKVASARKSTTLRRSTGPRRANKIAAVESAAKGFRADLRPVSLPLLPSSRA